MAFKWGGCPSPAEYRTDVSIVKAERVNICCITSLNQIGECAETPRAVAS